MDSETLGGSTYRERSGRQRREQARGHIDSTTRLLGQRLRPVVQRDWDRSLLVDFNQRV